MIDGKTILALIPARGGSRRLPGKNLRDLCGKPMIHYAIDEAKKSQYIDKIVVSTEDQAIMDACANKGVDILTRPMELAGDKSSVYDVIFHACAQYEPFDYVCLLQVTSPLRETEDIDGCIEHCVANHAPSCITVTLGRPDANGSVYFAWTSWLRETRLFDSGRVVVYPTPPERSVDVDRLEDFEKAESLMRSRLSGRSAVDLRSSTPPSWRVPRVNTSFDPFLMGR